MVRLAEMCGVHRHVHPWWRPSSRIAQICIKFPGHDGRHHDGGDPFDQVCDCLDRGAEWVV